MNAFTRQVSRLGRFARSDVGPLDSGPAGPLLFLKLRQAVMLKVAITLRVMSGIREISRRICVRVSLRVFTRSVMTTFFGAPTVLTRRRSDGMHRCG